MLVDYISHSDRSASRPFFVIALALLSIFTRVEVHAESVSKEDRLRVAEQIDRHIESSLDHHLLAPVLSDAAYLRRVTLDLAGRIPSVSELKHYETLEANDKKYEVTKQLIESPDFAYHQRNELDTLLLRALNNDRQWREYLLETTRNNTPWDVMFRQIMTPELTLPEDTRPTAFLKHRLRDLDKLANDSSMIWFGVNIGCAKCHDHPLVDDWKQEHYYGIASFFKRTYQTKKGMIVERFDGNLRFDTTEGETKDAAFMYLTGLSIPEPQLDLEEATLKEYQEQIKKAEQEDSADAPPQPSFQPRSELVKLALGDETQNFFAKNIVNRIWARLFGRGIVHPLDQIHSGNPASHPELLNLLTAEFIKNQYDLRSLIHTITLSNTYARSLPINDGSKDNQTPVESAPQDHEGFDVTESRFGHAVPRPLSPHQLSLSLLIATDHPEKLKEKIETNWEQTRGQLEERSEHFAQKTEIPGENFQTPVSEALWFSNSGEMQNQYLSTDNNHLVGYLKEIESDSEVISNAFAVILGRPPIQEEHDTLSKYLSSRSDRRTETIQQIAWVLLCSPEFRFNH